MDLRVLGPVTAAGPGGPARLHGARQRAVLGVLALHAGTVLPIPRLVDVLWGDDPPRTAVKTLHSHVARIRQALAECGFAPVLRTREPGYVLDVAPDLVDALRFEREVRAARKDIATGAVDHAVTTLRAAMTLWRGDAFADAALTGWGQREIDRLHELRLSTMEELWDALLRQGEHEDAVRELPRLLAAHPTRERLAGLHMLALYRCGRHTDALEAFHGLRVRLADEFGVDPGPELLALHTSILRRDPDLDPRQPAAGPAQLPARVGHFTGRDAELALLDRALDGERPVVLISGAAGMGKTALAIEWAHRIADRFPDGQLFIDLRGHDAGLAVSAQDALAHLLRSLDVADERVPGDPAERAALYRSELHDRRCVIVVDNVPSVAEILPLVPGTGPSLLVVTSRQALAALSSRHAVHPIALDALDHTASITLLTRVLGAERVAHERGPAARLARLCGGMPLALRIAAARLVVVDGVRPIAALARELVGGNRLDTLAVEGDSRTVRAVLASAYLPLDPAQATMFRRLGLSPGATFSTALGAALCGGSAQDGRRAADGLASAHLITGVAPDRFRFHDLIRDFARQCARTDEPTSALTEAGDRLVDWYLAVAASANLAIDPNRDLVTPTLRHPAPDRPFAADRHAALAFLAAERDNLLPVVRYARDNGRPAAAWQLTYLLTSFYDATGHWHERIELCRHGAAAATELGDAKAEAEMLRALGVAYFMVRRLHDALDTNAQALTAAKAAGDMDGEGHVYNNIANAYVELRRFDEAITAHRMAVARSAGNPFGHALAQRNLGYTYVRMGRAADSIAPLTGALATFRALGNTRLEAATLDTLGEAYTERGDHELALAYLGEAIAVSRANGDRWMEWESLLDAGVVHLGRKDFTAALADFEQSLVISREVGDRHGEAAALHHVGRALIGAGDLAAAREHLAAAMSVRARVPDDYQEAHLHRDLAELAARSGQDAAAAAHRNQAITLYRQANATAEADELAGTMPA